MNTCGLPIGIKKDQEFTDGALKLLTLPMTDTPLWLPFTNGLMSESMALWFGSMLVRNILQTKEENCVLS